MREDEGTASGEPPGFWGTLTALYRLLSPRRRRHLHASLLLMLAGAVAELVTIGAVLPFLAVLSGAAGEPASGPARAAFDLLGWHAGGTPIVGAALLLGGAALAAAGLRLALAWSTNAFAFRFGHELGVRIYARLLRQPYLYHVQRSSSEALAAVEKVQHSLVGVLLPLMQGVVAAFMAAFIVAMLIVIAPEAAIFSAIGVAALYAGVGAISRKSLRRTSSSLASAVTERIRQVQEGLGGIRDILLDRSQPVFERSFAEADDRLRRGQLKITFLAGVPRVAVEAGGIILIAIVAVAMSRQPGGLIAALPVLGAFAIGAQRLLPLVQSVYLSVTRIAGSAHAIDELVRLAEAPVPADAIAVPVGVPLEGGIATRSLSFHYPGTATAALTGIELRIAAGERVGLFGETGSGKSTLLDLLMGLLPPTSGEILVDGVTLDDSSRAAWQARISHVPQFIYLADASIASNIAFGAAPGTIDMDRVRAVAGQAQIADFIDGLPEGFATRVGERGVRLSGGQRQRIGLARALYKASSVLVLDEATSALDDDTEAAVMAALDAHAGGRTVIVVAHRLTTLASCDRLVRMRGGRIEAEGSYDELIANRRERRVP